MLDDVYNRRILELAADIPRQGRLATPDASATARGNVGSSLLLGGTGLATLGIVGSPARAQDTAGFPSRPIRVIVTFAAGGGLDLALELAIAGARSVCMVEREAFAVAHLVAAMRAGRLAPCPVWSDARTFDGRPWRGLVDGVIGGIPCQPHSLAGRRRGVIQAARAAVAPETTKPPSREGRGLVWSANRSSGFGGAFRLLRLSLRVQPGRELVQSGRELLAGGLYSLGILSLGDIAKRFDLLFHLSLFARRNFVA